MGIHRHKVGDGNFQDFGILQAYALAESSGPCPNANLSKEEVSAIEGLKLDQADKMVESRS